jgi:hypothetical protein
VTTKVLPAFSPSLNSVVSHFLLFYLANCMFCRFVVGTLLLPGFSPSLNSDAHDSLSLSHTCVVVVGALLAPTEILAKQHYHTIAGHFRALHAAPDTAPAAPTHARRRPFRVELITGAVKGRAREQLLTDLAAGDIDVLVGTHALLTDNVAGAFRRLGLVVIDEVTCTTSEAFPYPGPYVCPLSHPLSRAPWSSTRYLI